MDKAILVARILLGLIFVVFGINYFVPFIPQPEPSERAGAFLGALAASGYLFPFMKIVDIVCGLFLLAGRLVPLALTLLAPIIVNIVLYHVFLDMGGMVIGVVLIVLEVFLAWAYRDSFQGVLAVNAKPS
jgi:uncharacterized membrane protein YphA (DoxX/SURF4 family)